MRLPWLLGALAVLALAPVASAQSPHPLCPIERGLVMGVFEAIPGTLQVAAGPVRHHQAFATVLIRHQRLFEVQEDVVSPDFGFCKLPAGALVYEAQPGVFCGYGTIGRKGVEPQGLCFVDDAEGRNYLHSVFLADNTPWISPTVRLTACR